jgi:ATP-binding cassette subfamily B protein/ATP-binding cassette subfamily C protein/ATP-binding cassette subfamily B multidrug efflux pump
MDNRAPFPLTLTRLVVVYARQNWRPYLLSAIMLAAVAALTVSLPRQVGALVDGLANGTLHGDALLPRLLLMLATGAGIYGFRVAWRLQLFAASYRLGRELRIGLYQRLAAQGPAFFQQQRTGDLMALATNDVDAVEMAAGEAFLAGFDGTLTLIMVVAMMSLAIDGRLALVALAPFPLMAMAFWRISNQIHLASKDSLKRFSQLNDFTQETLSGVRTVRALGLEQRTAKDFADLAESAAEASLRAQRWEAAYEPSVGLTLVLAGALILGMGGYLVWQGELTVGALTAFSMYLVQLIWPMFAAGWVLSLLERGRAAWARLEPVLNTALSVNDHGHLRTLVADRLRFNDVSFNYPGQRDAALNHVSFSLAAGATLGLVGATGAGKSSIVRLILRQYEAQSGRVTWGGQALADYQMEALHDALRWVPQEAFLFSASIAENIALGKADASRAEIEQAARLAAIHDDILRFPQGYDTPVGERGVTLSGGQRQRVAIARALLADAPLLLLDDALSAVDTQTESDILQHLRNRRRESSGGMIVVSHRLSAVMEADEILVLEHGRIVERGTHAALLERDGWYAAQWRYQQLEASLDAA